MPQFINNLFGISKPENRDNRGPHNDNQRPRDAAHTSESALQNSSSTDVAASTVPENILAFRTITTMLSQLPRSKPIEAIDNLEGQISIPEYRREVRIYDAFAHLAASENDVAALTTNYNLGDGKLSIVACTQANYHVGETLPTSSPANLMAKINVWYLMLTRNFRRKEPESSSGTCHPTIISSSEPKDLGGRNAFAYMKGLEKHW